MLYGNEQKLIPDIGRQYADFAPGLQHAILLSDYGLLQT